MLVRSLPRSLLALALAASCALVAAGCGEDVADQGRDDPGEARGPTAEGESSTVRIEASRLLIPLARGAADVADERAGIATTVETASSDAAFAGLCAGRSEIVLAERRLTQGEARSCARNGVEPVRSLVGHHVVALYRNPELDLDCLTVDQLRRLWGAGGASVLPDAEPRLLASDPAGAAHELFVRSLFGSPRTLSDEAEIVEDRTRLFDEVRTTPDALAFGPYDPSARDAPPTVAVDSGAGCVPPRPATVQSNRYEPLSEPLVMYSTREALERRGVEQFVDYALDASQEVASYPGVVPPDPSEAAEAEPQR